MEIRHTVPEDLTRILEIYDSARAFMRKTGNMTQWGEGDKPNHRAAQDIRDGLSYVLCEGEKILAVFAFDPEADDPTYHVISDGQWPDCESYGVLHRIAVGEPGADAAGACLDWCAARCKQLRVDTHADNHPMQRAMAKNGFARCGIIQTFDGTDRIAFARDDRYRIAENDTKRKRLFAAAMGLYMLAVVLLLVLAADVLTALNASRLYLVGIFALTMLPGCLMISNRLRKGGGIDITPEGFVNQLTERGLHGSYRWADFRDVYFGKGEKTLELVPRDEEAFRAALSKRARKALRQRRVRSATLPLNTLLLSDYDRKRLYRAASERVQLHKVN